MLVFYIFLLSDENNRNLLNSIGICDSIIFFEVRSILQIVKDILNRCYVMIELPLSDMDEQIGMNLPYLFSYEFPYMMLLVTLSMNI